MDPCTCSEIGVSPYSQASRAAIGLDPSKSRLDDDFFRFFLANQSLHSLEDCEMDLTLVWVPKLTDLWQVVDGKICRHDQTLTYFVLEPRKECAQPRSRK